MDNFATESGVQRSGFPVSLVCPTCHKSATADSLCATTGKLCLTDYLGMPRFLFGQKYWGETSSEKMRKVLQAARDIGWRTALLRHVGDERLSKHLLAGVRADLLHALPWDRIRKVLDVGAGMGFMSCDMARYAESVVALEAVPERAEFLQIRARQDTLPVFPIIANAMAMPFPPESFDLITLNGAFEYLGLWGDGDPQEVQEAFLKSALQLLRPGGYLYVGVETRYAASAFLGHLDHSGLAFTSLMPRKMADLYCRFRSKPIYGAEHVASGYRTYTYSPSQYKKMFLRAGYSEALIQGVFDGYNRQRVLYDMREHAARKAVLDRVNPAASTAGILRRLCTENRLVYRILEGEVVILAKKEPLDGMDLPWSEVLEPTKTVVQVNLPFKILGVICEKGVPLEVLEVEKKGEMDAGRRLEYSFETLQTLQQRLGPEISTLPMRWPAPRGTQRISGRVYRRYEYIAGQSLSTLLLPVRYDPRKVAQLIPRAIMAYVALCRRLSEALPSKADGSNWHTVEDQLADIEVSDDIREDYRLAVTVARDSGWQLSAVHGDFTASNLLLTPSGELVLIDWEHFSRGYFVGADLVRFYQDAALDSGRLPIEAGGAFRNGLKKAVTDGLLSCGYRPAHFSHLRALYMGHQIAALGGEDRVHPPLLKAYRSRQLLADV